MTINTVRTKPGIYRQSARISGFNADIDTTTDPEDIWGAGIASLPDEITWPATSGNVIEFVSDSVEDEIGFTGAQVLVIDGIRSNLDQHIEHVATSGTFANITSLAEFIFVNEVKTFLAGSVKINVGNISFALGIAGPKIGVMPALSGKLSNAMYMVPNSENSNESAYLVRSWAYTGNISDPQSVDVKLLRYPLPIQSGDAYHSIEDVIIGDGNPYNQTYAAPIKLTPGDRIWWKATATTVDNASVVAGFDIVWY